MDNVVSLLNPTTANLKRVLNSLPLSFVKEILVHIQSCPAVPPDVEHDWFVERLLHEVEDVGLELFVQKLHHETVQESCSLLNLGANEEEFTQLQISLESYAKNKRTQKFLESLDTEVLERYLCAFNVLFYNTLIYAIYCNDLKIRHKTAAPKEDIEDTLTSEILLLGLEGLLDLLTLSMLRDYYTALRIGASAPIVLKKTQLIEEIVLHSFNTRFDYSKIKHEAETPRHTSTHTHTRNSESEDSDDPDYQPPSTPYATSSATASSSSTSSLVPPSTPLTTGRLTAADIHRTTPRKDLDRMLVKDLREYLQTQGLKYDDKRSVLLNRIIRYHKGGGAGPPTPLIDNLSTPHSNHHTSNGNGNNNNNSGNESEGSESERDKHEPSAKRKAKRFAHDIEAAANNSPSGSTKKRARSMM